jgi:hypothetical protein
MSRQVVILSLAALAMLWSVPAVAQPVRVKTSGSVVSVAPGFIYMVSDEQQRHAVKVPTDKKVITVTGRLNHDQLRPGMIVRFSGTLNGHTLEEEVSEVTVFTPADGFPPGILMDETPPLITGRVQSFKAATLVVTAGRQRVTAKLADDAAVKVNTGDHSVVPAGARIEVSGYLTKATGQISPQRVNISLPDPSGAAASPPGAAPKKK